MPCCCAPSCRALWFAVAVLLTASLSASPQPRAPMAEAHLADIATLLQLEDTRRFDPEILTKLLDSPHPEVRRRAVVTIGRLANPAGRALLEKVRGDANVEVAASVAFATGQLRHADDIAWLSGVLQDDLISPIVQREAARALGKIRSPDARTALAAYLLDAQDRGALAAVIGEALLSIGRFTTSGDVAPIARWGSSMNVELRWRAAWALFRIRQADAIPHLLKLAGDGSGEVRFWAVRGLTPALVDAAAVDRASVVSLLDEAVDDRDRRVRTEALRALVQYDDDAAFAALVTALDSPDTWLSVSAAEAAGRFASRADELAPALVEASGPDRPTWLRMAVLAPLSTVAPALAVDAAAALAKNESAVARASAVQALGRLGAAGRAKLEELAADPALTAVLPTTGGGRRGGASRPPAPARTEADYRRLVDDWIATEYQGRPRPRVIWDTTQGEIELELYPGDAPFGVEYLLAAVASGDIVGTEFGRVIPNFVAQQQAVRNAPTLRDEVNRHGLTRGTLSWASSGLDTGRPGFTLGSTPQPHNEGDFTALGRVVRGMDVMDRLELGDRILATRVVQP